MGSFSLMHWIIVLAVVMLVFGGAGKIPRLMGDLAKGIKSFKEGMKDEQAVASNSQPQVTQAQTTTQQPPHA